MKNILRFFGMIILLGINILAQEGIPDPTFDTDGIVSTNILQNDFGYGVALQTDGKIVVAGYADNGDFVNRFAVARYNSNGTLDNSFGTNGIVTTNIGYWGANAYAVKIQTDGKIVVAGYSYYIDREVFTVARYTTNGTLDTDFDTDGIAIAYFDDGGANAQDMVIQPDGKILVVGYVYNEGYEYSLFAAVRFDTDGSNDETFNGGSFFTFDWGYEATGSAVGLQSDGKIVITGTFDNGSNYLFSTIRLDDSGLLDNTFDTDGVVTTAIGEGHAFAEAIAIQSDGKILVGGMATISSNDDYTLVRYNSDGSLDNTFGTNGIVTTDFNGVTDYVKSLVVQSDGKIVAGGTSGTSGDDVFSAARYSSTGTLDNTFGTNGKVTTDIGEYGSYGEALAIQTDGKIILAGYLYNDSGQEDFAIVRYSDGSALPVELFSFTAKIGDKNVVLSWQTATEVNNYGFEIERQTVETLRATSNEWETIGFVEGHGNSNSPKDYTFTDNLLNLSLNLNLKYRLKQIDFDGNYEYSDEITVELGELVKAYKLEQNYPNPFNPSTTISYSIPNNVKTETSNVKLIVYDILGNEVATLVNERQKSGNYEVKFDASNLASGIYIYKLQNGSFVQTKKLMLLK